MLIILNNKIKDKSMVCFQNHCFTCLYTQFYIKDNLIHSDHVKESMNRFWRN